VFAVVGIVVVDFGIVVCFVVLTVVLFCLNSAMKLVSSAPSSMPCGDVRDGRGGCGVIGLIAARGRVVAVRLVVVCTLSIVFVVWFVFVFFVLGE